MVFAPKLKTLFLCLSIFLSVCLSVYHLSTYQSIYRPIKVSIDLSKYPSTYQTIHRPIKLSIHLSNYQPINPSINQSINPLINQPTNFDLILIFILILISFSFIICCHDYCSGRIFLYIYLYLSSV